MSLEALEKKVPELNKLAESIEQLKFDEKLPNNLKKIDFKAPEFQTGGLHPETRCKFVKIHSIELSKGAYGPFFRYTPKERALKATNETGGYFTNRKTDCIGCAKRALWLYDKERRYFYRSSGKLFRYLCFFVIKDDMEATLFYGKVAFGGAIQIRPNNYVLGNDPKQLNGVYYVDEPKELKRLSCTYCKGKDFFDAFEKNT